MKEVATLRKNITASLWAVFNLMFFGGIDLTQMGCCEVVHWERGLVGRFTVLGEPNTLFGVVFGPSLGW